MPKRRTVLAGASAWLGLSWLNAWPQGTPGDGQRLKLGPPKPFSFEGLIREAQTRSTRPYVRSDSLPQDVLERIDYEAHGKIQFNTDYALYRDGPGVFPVTFFHLGRYFRTPVHMYALAQATPQTQAREILYDPLYFRMPADSPARELPKGAGFAGFRFQESRKGDQSKLPWRRNDWVAFLGASYFRAIGELYQYGLSARGLAIDVVMPQTPEEFPDFTHFYFEPPSDSPVPPAAPGEHATPEQGPAYLKGAAPPVTVYALLEGPSVTGAYSFRMWRGKAVVMDIEAHLFLRRDIARLGIAPMTSMFWYSESVKPQGIDWRPEVHDSDGLALWTGGGERIWRPLNNPEAIAVSAFTDHSPRGFGLLQRDRLFDHYLDGVAYERRPSLWVEPRGDWGEGTVQLIELPTDDEIHDNIVAMWVPKEPARAGSRQTLRYRLHWTDEEPYPTPLARCVATRLGRGGQPGQPRPKGVTKFVVEFLGGPLTQLPYGVKPEPVLSASSGTFSYVFTEAVPDSVPGHWRAQFDFTPSSPGVVDMRLFLRQGSQTLSETWIYQLRPLP